MRLSEHLVFRLGNALMALLFGFAAALQLNDPDPVRWIAVYGAASVLAALLAFRVRLPIVLLGALGVVALLWGLAVDLEIDRHVFFGELFSSWKMNDARVELAREAGGLFIITGWVVAVGVCSVFQPRRRSVPPI